MKRIGSVVALAFALIAAGVFGVSGVSAQVNVGNGGAGGLSGLSCGVTTSLTNGADITGCVQATVRQSGTGSTSLVFATQPYAPIIFPLNILDPLYNFVQIRNETTSGFSIVPVTTNGTVVTGDTSVMTVVILPGQAPQGGSSAPTSAPTATPTPVPTSNPTATPTAAPTATATPTIAPTPTPTPTPTAAPTASPTPTATPTVAPTATPTAAPTATPTAAPTQGPLLPATPTLSFSGPAAPSQPITFSSANYTGPYAVVSDSNSAVATASFSGSTLTVSAADVGSASIVVSAGSHQTTVTVNVAQPPLAISSTNVAFAYTNSATQYDAFTTPGFSGTCNAPTVTPAGVVTVNLTGTRSLGIIAAGVGSATISTTCGAQTGAVNAQVNAAATPGPVTLGTVAGQPNQFTANEFRYAGSFAASIGDPTVASITPASAAGPNGTFTLGAVAAGSTTAVVTGYNGNALNLPLVVSNPSAASYQSLLQSQGATRIWIGNDAAGATSMADGLASGDNLSIPTQATFGAAALLPSGPTAEQTTVAPTAPFKSTITRASATTPFSISGLVLLPTLPSDTELVNMDDTAANHNGFECNIPSTGALYCNTGNGTAVTLTGSSAGRFVAGRPAHFAITYDGTTLALYVNGVPSGSRAVVITPGAVGLEFAKITSSGTVGSTPLVGSMQYLTWMPAALTAAQVLAQYQASTYAIGQGAATQTTSPQQGAVVLTPAGNLTFAAPPTADQTVSASSANYSGAYTATTDDATVATASVSGSTVTVHVVGGGSTALRVYAGAQESIFSISVASPTSAPTATPTIAPTATPTPVPTATPTPTPTAVAYSAAMSSLVTDPTSFYFPMNDGSIASGGWSNANANNGATLTQIGDTASNNNAVTFGVNVNPPGSPTDTLGYVDFEFGGHAQTNTLITPGASSFTMINWVATSSSGPSFSFYDSNNLDPTLFTDSNGAPAYTMLMADGSYTTLNAANSITVGTPVWHLISSTVDTTAKRATLYVDGASARSTTYTGTIHTSSAGNALVASGPMPSGTAITNNPGTQGISGYLGRVAYIPRALSASEEANLWTHAAYTAQASKVGAAYDGSFPAQAAVDSQGYDEKANTDAVPTFASINNYMHYRVTRSGSTSAYYVNACKTYATNPTTGPQQGLREVTGIAANSTAASLTSQIESLRNTFGTDTSGNDYWLRCGSISPQNEYDNSAPAIRVGLNTAVTTLGVHTVNVDNTNSMQVGMYLMVGTGSSGSEGTDEGIVLTAIGSGTITANFTKTHTATENVYMSWSRLMAYQSNLIWQTIRNNPAHPEYRTIEINSLPFANPNHVVALDNAIGTLYGNTCGQGPGCGLPNFADALHLHVGTCGDPASGGVTGDGMYDQLSTGLSAYNYQNPFRDGIWIGEDALYDNAYGNGSSGTSLVPYVPRPAGRCLVPEFASYYYMATRVPYMFGYAGLAYRMDAQEGDGQSYNEGNYDHAGNPKPQFYAMAQMLNLLQDPSYNATTFTTSALPYTITGPSGTICNIPQVGSGSKLRETKGCSVFVRDAKFQNGDHAFIVWQMSTTKNLSPQALAGPQCTGPFNSVDYNFGQCIGIAIASPYSSLPSPISVTIGNLASGYTVQPYRLPPFSTCDIATTQMETPAPVTGSQPTPDPTNPPNFVAAPTTHCGDPTPGPQSTLTGTTVSVNAAIEPVVLFYSATPRANVTPVPLLTPVPPLAGYPFDLNGPSGIQTTARTAGGQSI